MASDLGVRAEFADIIWADHLKALLDGDVDLLMSYTNTPERALHVDFAGPLLPSDVVVMVRNEAGSRAPPHWTNRRGASEWKRLFDRPRRPASLPRARVLESRSPAPALKNGEFDAWLTDAVTRIFMKQNPELRLLREPAVDCSSLPASTVTPRCGKTIRGS